MIISPHRQPVLSTVHELHAPASARSRPIQARLPALRRASVALAAGAAALLAACGGGGDDDGSRSAAAAFADAARMAQPEATSDRRQRLSNDAASVNAEVLLRWAEFKFPDLFPASAASIYPSIAYGGQTYYAREYRGAWGSRYLGVTTTGEVHGLGDWTNNALQRYGVIGDWTAQVLADRCAFEPAACAAAGVAQPKVVVAGRTAAFGLQRNGAVVGWGPAGIGLGRQALITGTSVRPVTLPVPVVDISGYETHFEVAGIPGGRTLAVGNDGLLYGWGNSPGGQLGNRPPGSIVATPTRIDGVDDIAAALAIDTHSLLLRKDGSLWVWPGSTTPPNGPGVAFRYAPGQSTQPGPLARILPSKGPVVFPGPAVALALLRDGRAARVQIDLGTAGGSIVTAPAVTPIDGWTGLSDFDCSSSHCVGVKADGTVIAAGSNDRGQLGQGNTRAVAGNAVVTVPGLARIVDVAVFDTTSFAVDADGRLWAWGDRQYSALGPGADVIATSPAQVPGLSSVTRIDTNGAITAVTRSGQVFSWSVNLDAFIGSDAGVRVATPVQARGVVLAN